MRSLRNAASVEDISHLQSECEHHEDMDANLVHQISRKKTLRKSLHKKRGKGAGSDTDEPIPALPISSVKTHEKKFSTSSFSNMSMMSSFLSERPAAKEIADNLEKYFPGHDLDNPMDDDSSACSTLIIGEEDPDTSIERRKLVNRKSIRVVVKERNMEESMMQENMPVALKRTSTKLWGSKPTEIRNTGITRKKGVMKRKGFANRYDPPESLQASRIIVLCFLSLIFIENTIKWIKGELIGKGSFGRVYHALNAATGEMIAVKQVNIPKIFTRRKDSKNMVTTSYYSSFVLTNIMG